MNKVQEIQEINLPKSVTTQHPLNKCFQKLFATARIAKKGF
jgi:hypothetical protein